VATSRVDAPGEGPQKLTLTLKKGVRNLLAKKGHLQVRINVGFGALESSAQFALTQKVVHKKKKAKGDKPDVR
jgi:hypothetical protein